MAGASSDFGRDALGRARGSIAQAAQAATGTVKAGGIEPARAHAVAEALMAAENPIALTANLGRNPDDVAVLNG